MKLFPLVAAALALLPHALTHPLGAPADAETGLEKRAIQSPPHWAIYWDKWVPGETGPPAVSLLKGYNVLLLSFLLLAGPWDQAQVWVSLDAATRASIKAQYAAAGIKLMVSAFGSSDAPVTAGADPVATANKFAAFVKQYSFDGIDIDFEDFGAMDSGTGAAENWLISFTRTLRNALPASSYIITHAPVAPWFSPGKYGGGGYLKVHQQVGSLIDWYNIQFYNQGPNEYTTCNNLLTASSSAWPNTAVFQIAASGVDQSKIVIGKIGVSSSGSGYVAPATLATCLSQAKAKGWNAGAMVWQYPDAGSSWITTVRSQSWPV